MGIWHQMFKNILDIPVVSPYQSPRFLDDLFYRFDPYFVDRAGDVRPAIGALLLGREVKYPRTNPRPEPWRRDRGASIGVYLEQLKQDGISCQERRLRSWWVGKREAVESIVDRHSSKRRTTASKALFPARRWLGRVIPALRITRHDLSAREIR